MTPNFASVANRAQELTFQNLADFCSAVIAAMTANAVTFPVPPIALATFATDVAAYQASVTAWGAVGNRGSHSTYLGVLAGQATCLVDLQAEAGYVQSVARSLFPGDIANQKATITLAGMRPKNDSNTLALWGQPQDLRQLVPSNLIGSGIILLRWKKPLVVPGAMSRPPAYNIYAETSPGSGVFTYYSASSSTGFIDTPRVRGSLQAFEVAAVSAAGIGALSNPIICVAP